jgi:Arc/MetJ-type ribon-helix-helix transcriptional regulator
LWTWLKNFTKGANVEESSINIRVDDYLDKNIDGMIDKADVFFWNRSEVVRFILRRYFKNKEMKDRRKRKIEFIF